MSRRLGLRKSALVAVVFLSQFGTLWAGRTAIEPTGGLAFLQPWVVLEPEDHTTLAQRGVVVRSLPASDQQIGVIAVCPISLTADAFLASVTSSAYMGRSEQKGGRFSSQPSLADLAGLSLDSGDIDRLRDCVSGDCALNLADSEISAMRAALTPHTRGRTADVNHVFREVVLNRVRHYQSGGLAAVPEYHDRRDPQRPSHIFAEILQQTPYLRSHVPDVLAYLERFPTAEARNGQSTMFWSKMTMNGKPVVLVTHVTTFRLNPSSTVPAAMLTGKQVYASRYMNGDLTLTMLFPGTPSYLVHINRSHLDALRGSFRGFKRAALESPIKAEVVEALVKLRDRLERLGSTARRH